MIKTVWIIDDDESILDVIDIVLEKEGYQSRTIRDASILDTLLQDQSKPDLILLDVLMSGIDGRDVAHNLKKHKNTKDIPIVIMTADIHVEEKAKAAGADGFLRKPFNIEDLIKIVKKFSS
ncbi:MAG TPA: response regulator [Candidatus Nitrosocosmicus sp.]|nr:response regulator [Candidatus Nitrosocosmicus sp.]